MTVEELLEHYATVANGIVTKLNQARRPSPVTTAIELLLGRIVGAGSSLRVLRENAHHDFAFDAAMILRGIYDAMLQALYILVDETNREERAQLYLDYFWIEKEQAINLYDKRQTYLSKRISQSPRRASAEPLIEQEIQRVRPKYVNTKGKPRNHWYEGDLRVLAGAVGLEAEYELFQKNFSGVVHSSPYALQEGMPIKGAPVETMAWRFSFRVLGRFAEFKGVALDEQERELVRLSQGNVFDDQSRPSRR